MSNNSNTVVHAAPPAPPGPATFDYSRFRGNAATKMVDTQALTVTANTVTSCKVQAASLQTTMLSAAAIASYDVGPGNVAIFKPTILLSNTGTLFTQPMYMQRSVTVGNVFNWTPPTYSSILPVVPRLNGTTFGQTYPLVGGQLAGYAVMYVPQPPLATQGTIINLNGGSVKGNASLFH